MDLNPPENLDPKLKEAYERMAGNKPNIQIVNESHPISETPIINSAPQVREPVDNTPEEKSHGGHKKLFLLIGIFALIFLVAYGVIWAKIFNLI